MSFATGAYLVRKTGAFCEELAKVLWRRCGGIVGLVVRFLVGGFFDKLLTSDLSLPNFMVVDGEFDK